MRYIPPHVNPHPSVTDEVAGNSYGMLGERRKRKRQAEERKTQDKGKAGYGKR